MFYLVLEEMQDDEGLKAAQSMTDSHLLIYQVNELMFPIQSDRKLYYQSRLRTTEQAFGSLLTPMMGMLLQMSEHSFPLKTPERECYWEGKRGVFRSTYQNNAERPGGSYWGNEVSNEPEPIVYFEWQHNFGSLIKIELIKIRPLRLKAAGSIWLFFPLLANSRCRISSAYSTPLPPFPVDSLCAGP